MGEFLQTLLSLVISVSWVQYLGSEIPFLTYPGRDLNFPYGNYNL